MTDFQRERRTVSSSGAQSRHRGIRQLIASYLSTLADYAHLRLQLFSLEAREAGTLYGRKFVFLGIAALFLLIAYPIFLAGGIGWLAQAVERPWWEITLYTAAGHLVLALGFFAAARQVLSRPLFRDTLREFERDRQWLKDQKENP